LGLGRKIALGAAFGLFAMQVPCLAGELVACDMKKAPRVGAAEAGVRKPAKPVERARVERREAVYYSPTPSRRIILQ
jgi:hypothetical protein